jgi:hypothetical protein
MRVPAANQYKILDLKFAVAHRHEFVVTVRYDIVERSDVETVFRLARPDGADVKYSSTMTLSAPAMISNADS